MDKNRMRYAFVIVPVLMGLVVFVVLFLAGTKSDKEQMEKNAEETLKNVYNMKDGDWNKKRKACFP